MITHTIACRTSATTARGNVYQLNVSEVRNHDSRELKGHRVYVCHAGHCEQSYDSAEAVEAERMALEDIATNLDGVYA